MKTLYTLVACLLLGITPVVTAQHNALAQPHHLLSKNKILDASRAAASVQRQYGGRVLAVETLQRKGKLFYRIKILTRKGVVRVIWVNARTGRFK